MIKSKIVYVNLSGFMRRLLDNPNLDEINREINIIGKENILQITCAGCTEFGDVLAYTIFYDDGQ